MAECITNWKDMCERINTLDEEELRQLINFEVSTFKRRTVIERMHQRFTKLRSTRERVLLITGETLL